MNTLDREVFDGWLQEYGRASRDNDAQASAELFSQNAAYYETPFDDPMLGREAIRKYWEIGAHTLRDKESTYEILSVKNNLGIAHWQSKFTDITSSKRIALDCVFIVEFDGNGLCSVFREWWHLKPLKIDPEW